MEIPKEKNLYTAIDFFKFTENNQEHFELINGEIVAMSSPSEIHQTIVTNMAIDIGMYIRNNHGECKILVAPFDVKLDDYNVVVPDISITCDKSKFDGKRCNGSPDWVIEVVSSNWKDDYIRKLALYEKFGVREYWIVDPQKQTTFVWFFDDKNTIGFYDFNKNIPVNIYRDNSIKLEINISKLLQY